MKITAPVVRHIAALAGVAARPTKTATLAAIDEYVAMVAQLPPGPVVGVDIGIKNFSWCVMNPPAPSLTEISPDAVIDWGTANLIDDTPYTAIAGASHPLDLQRQLIALINHRAKSWLRHQPQLVIIETQRMASNSNQRTLPAVLANIRVELWVSQAVYPTVAVPMTLAQMASFWLHRFFCRTSLPKTSKPLRIGLCQLIMAVLKEDIRARANIVAPQKIDDAVDLFLYAVAGHEQIEFCRHLATLKGIANACQDHPQELLSLVDQFQRRHWRWALPLLELGGLRSPLTLTPLAESLNSNGK